MAGRSAGQTRSALVRADKLRVAGQLPEAERALREILQYQPKYHEAWLSLAKLLAARGELAAAEHAYGQVVGLDPSAFEARVNLGLLLAERGALSESLEQYRSALAQKPDHALALRNYGGLLRAAGELGEAVRVLTRSLELSPDDAGAHTNLGLALSALGQHDSALAQLERAVLLAPREPLYHDNLLLLMHYTSEIGPEAIFAAHQRYGRMARELFARLPERALRPLPRRLRIGYVSADFRRHSVAFFLEPLLEHHDRSRFELFAYSGVLRPDEVTVRFAQSFDHYREVARHDDASLAALIQRDQIDILVDLAGHTQGNRLGVFAQKPAPIQLTYLGYPDTTGLDAIDYRVTDSWADPEGAAEALHSERLLRLDGGFLCYRPPEPSPPLAAPPSTSGAPPTFGSFNALAKISDQTLALWGTLLARTPGARLLLKPGFLSHSESKQALSTRLVQHGIDPRRVLLQGHLADLHGHLAAYQQVDVALDTFPYHGTTTSCDALWMGVPIVSLAGASHVSRVGVSLLSRVGLSELVADSAEAYVDKAHALLCDEGRRTELRSSLRARMAQAGLSDGPRVTRAFERALSEVFASSFAHGSAREDEDEDADLPDVDGSREPPPPDPAARWFRLSSGLSIAIPARLDQITSYALEEQGEWFEDEIHFVRKLLAPGDTVLDVGANHGVYALAMAQAVGPNGRVCAIEPARSIAARLLASAARNGFSQLSVVRCAVSNREGSARLQIGASSELSALATAGVVPGAGEEVRLATLDQLCREQRLEQVAFAKLDVEGEELRALSGAQQLIEAAQPLWMVERKHGAQENHGLLESLVASGHEIFRLVPGLDVLFPHPPGTDSDPFLLNVFAARPGRSQQLLTRGLLARFCEDLTLPDTVGWQEALAATTLAGRADLARGFDADTPGKQRHRLALCSYALSRRADLSSTERAFYLRSGLAHALSAIEDPHDLSRLMTLARLAFGWGRRAIAIEALSTALSAVNNGKARIDEPFLPVSPRYDQVEPGARLSDFVVSSLLEQLERLRSFSGYFDENPKDAIGRLTLISRLGFQSPEMARRLALAQKR